MNLPRHHKRIVMTGEHSLRGGKRVAHRYTLGQKIVHAIAICVSFSFLVFAVVVSGSAILERKKLDDLITAMQQVKVIPPKLPPQPSQEAVDLAVELYTIKKTTFLIGPFYDATLEDRGVTSGGVVSPRKIVNIGPAAFSSWAILGSTLGHEVEVHVAQPFFLIVLQDNVSLTLDSAKQVLRNVVDANFLPWSSARADFSGRSRIMETFESATGGTWKAERDAYKYELSNRRRFGLSKKEEKSIQSIMEYYYPNPGTTLPLNRNN